MLKRGLHFETPPDSLPFSVLQDEDLLILSKSKFLSPLVLCYFLGVIKLVIGRRNKQFNFPN